MNTHTDPRLTKAAENIVSTVSKSKLESSHELQDLLTQFCDLDELLKHSPLPGLGSLCGIGKSITQRLVEKQDIGAEGLRELLGQLAGELHAHFCGSEDDKQSAEDIVRAAMESLENNSLRLTVQNGRLLGEVLQAMSMLDAESVEQALALQRKTGMMFGKALIKLGRLTPEKLETALRVQQQRRSREGMDPTTDERHYGTSQPLTN
jgi:hypothetical protein